MTLADLSALPEHLRTKIEVANFTELTNALRSGVSIVCTQDIVATSQILLHGSTTLTAAKITKDFAGDALIANASTNGQGITLNIDELTTSATGEGRLVYLTTDHIRIGGNAGTYLGIGVWRPYNQTQRTCVEVSGSDTKVYLTGGLPEGDAGDLGHISGGSGHYMDVLDGVANDDCVAVSPRASTGLSVDNVKVKIRNGTSYRSRLLMVGVSDTKLFDDYEGSVSKIKADVTGRAYTLGSLAKANRGGVMVQNRPGNAASIVSDFDITADVICNPLYTEYGVRCMSCENGNVQLTAAGFSIQPSFLVNTTNVSINA